MEKIYSGKQIIKAGKNLIDTEAIKDSEKFSSAMDVLSFWRFSHAVPRDTAFIILQKASLVNDKSAFFAKRLKRYISIIRKLRRFDTMKLKNMQDIGGCRVILKNEKKLRQTVRTLRKMPEFRYANGKYKFKDYIKNPKEDGYRSYHLIGHFLGTDSSNKNIEIQLRTRLQHYWATALEIVDLFTDQALKSNQGDEIWRKFFINVAEQLAFMDSIHLFDAFTIEKKLEKYNNEIKNNTKQLESIRLTQDFCNELEVFRKLEAFAGSLEIINDEMIEMTKTGSGYILLSINTDSTKVNATIFDEDAGKKAEEKYIEAEKEAATESNMIIALVSTTAIGNIKEAYPNYFADSSEFMEHLNLITKTHQRIDKSKIKGII